MGSSLFGAFHHLGEVGEEAALKKQELINSLDHDQRAIDTSQKISQAWSDYGQLEGDAAVKGLPTFQARLKSIFNEAVEGAPGQPKPNDAVRRMVADSAYRDVDRYMGHGASYADTQLRSWHQKVHTDALNESRNQAVLSRNQPIEVIEDIIEKGPNGVGGLNSVREKMLHKFGADTNRNSPEVKNAIEGEVKDARSKAVLPIVKELADENNIDRAEAVFKHFKNKMSREGIVAAEGFLRPKLLDRDAVRIADARRPVRELGSIPSTKAERERAGLMSSPSRENAARFGFISPETHATGKHASDYFMSLESGRQGIGYVNTHDTDGSHSYGNLGVNSRGGEGSSAFEFFRKNAHLGLTGRPGTAEADASWAKVAREHPAELRAAETKWWDEKYFNPVAPGLKAAGVPPSIADNKAVQYYMADRAVQQGPHKINSPSHMLRFKQAADMADGDPQKFIQAMNAGDMVNLWKDFPTAMSQGPSVYSVSGNDTRLRGRTLAAQRADSMMRGEPQPQPGPQPDSPLSPQYASRQARREGDREYAHRMSNGNHELENKIYTTLQQRAFEGQASLANAREVVQSSVKNLETMASLGVPGITLEKGKISEKQIHDAYPNEPEKANRIIETVKVQAANADHLHSLAFAPKADIDHHVAETSSGLGTQSMIEHFRKGQGETGPFAAGAQPDSPEDFNHRADLHIKNATMSKQYAERRQEILDHNPAAWAIQGQEPHVMAARQVLKDAKTPEDKAVAFRNYAAAQIALQKQMGVAPENIHVLTADAAREQSEFVMNSHDPKGTLDSLEKTYGAQWGSIFHDMAKIGGLPTKYEFVQLLPDEDARVLSNALKEEAGVAKDGKKENPRNWEESLGPDLEGKPVKRTIDSLISGNQSMKDLQESMARRGINMLTQGNEIVDSVRSLAYGYKSGIGGKAAMDHVSAANKAVDAFVANHVFTRDKAMIPKANADEIQKIMAFTRDSLTNMSTHIPGWTEKGPARGLPSQRDYLEAAKNGGCWVNTHNGDGVEYRDHNNRTVRYNDGKPVRVMFNDLSEPRKRMNSTQYFQEPEAPIDSSAWGTGGHG